MGVFPREGAYFRSMPPISPAVSPALSVVLATRDTVEPLRRTIRSLLRQTVVAEVELVLVAPTLAELGVAESDLADWRGRFRAVTLVEAGEVGSIGAANAAGIRAASSPIVALAEDHCFPAPEWAAALIKAHHGPWAAVGPVVENANPGSAVSWADLFIGYGPWLAPCEATEAPFLPGHNTCYKRDVLLALGERLPELMEAETLLHWELRRAGHRLRVEPTAAVRHTNFALWRAWIPVQYFNGRLFAGARRREMSLARRVVFTLGSPLIPLVRGWRLWQATPRGPLRRRFLATTPALAIGLLLDALGQGVGYALGSGDAVARVAHYEFDRFRYIRPADRAALADV
jgi:GT2 family glycosyltransferase